VSPSLPIFREDVPATRADCPTQRPCPHINCRYHLWHVDGVDMPGRRYAGKTPAGALRVASSATCTLDEAVRPRSVREIADVMGMTPRRVQQLLKALLALPRVAEMVREIRGEQP
jgi:hypothetical protein